MTSSRVIRIDDDVWAELQRRARPLEDTPNSVLRRVLGLPEDAVARTHDYERRALTLVALVEDLVGERPSLRPARRGYEFLSHASAVVAYLRPQKGRLRITAGKEAASRAGLEHWDRERARGPWAGPGVVWYLPDGDEPLYLRGAQILAKLWRSGQPSPQPA